MTTKKKAKAKVKPADVEAFFKGLVKLMKRHGVHRLDTDGNDVGVTFEARGKQRGDSDYETRNYGLWCGWYENPKTIRYYRTDIGKKVKL